MSDKIFLFPGNWLYNASVVGFIQSYPDFFELKENYAEFNRDIFTKIDAKKYIDANQIANLKGNNVFYRNFLDSKGEQFSVFENFIFSLQYVEKRLIAIFAGRAILLKMIVMKNFIIRAIKPGFFLIKFQNLSLRIIHFLKLRLKNFRIASEIEKTVLIFAICALLF